MVKRILLTALLTLAFGTVAQAQFHQDDTDAGGNTEDCGEISPDEPCYVSGGGVNQECPRKTNYNTCLKNCKCERDKAVKKCKNIQCHHSARIAKDICDSGCLTDFIP